MHIPLKKKKKVKKDKTKINTSVSWKEITMIIKRTLKNLETPLLNLDSLQRVFVVEDEELLNALNSYLNGIPENKKLIKGIFVFLNQISIIEIIKMNRENLFKTIGQNFFQVDSKEYTTEYLMRVTTAGTVPIDFMIFNADKLCPDIK